MRFYLDEDLSGKVARIARERGVDAVSSHECGHDGLPDRLQLEFAAREDRCLVTANRNDFTDQTLAFFEREWPHAGVLIVPASLLNRGALEIAKALTAYDRRHPEGVPHYAIDFLSPDRG